MEFLKGFSGDGRPHRFIFPNPVRFSMRETTASQTLEAAFRLIDTITRIKGVLGALLMDQNGDIIAQDFILQADQDRYEPFATDLIPHLVKGATELKLGAITDVMFQTTNMTLRFAHHERIWLAIFAGNNVNVGMLNVELRGARTQFRTIGGGAVAAERDSQKEEVIEALRTEGSITRIMDARSGELTSLRALHAILFQLAIDNGVTRDTISRRINDINYRIYRDSLLDIGFDFFNRKALDNYDPVLARKLMREQILGLTGMLLQKLKPS